MKLSVLYGCDDNYAPYTGVSMLSLFENNKHIDDLTVYLASMGIEQDNINKLSNLANSYGRKIIILDTEKAVEKTQSYRWGSWNNSVATWLRFFVLDQIPDDVDRLLWLDSDTLVKDSLDYLATLDMGDSAVGAALDSLSYYHRFRLSVPRYYNAGVLLFNLKVWRENNTLDEMMSHLEKNIDRYPINDQDLLNDFFSSSIICLPNRFNFQGTHVAYTDDQYQFAYKWKPGEYYSKEELASARQNPAVIHFFRFLGDYPWTDGMNLHPCKNAYNDAKRVSSWKDNPMAPRRKEFVFKAEKVLYITLPKALFLYIFKLYTNRELIYKRPFSKKS